MVSQYKAPGDPEAQEKVCVVGAMKDMLLAQFEPGTVRGATAEAPLAYFAFQTMLH